MNEIVGTETEPVTDEALKASVIEWVNKQKSTLLQVWYASDLTGAQIDPPADAEASLADWEAADLNGSGRLNATDLTLMKRALMQ